MAKAEDLRRAFDGAFAAAPAGAPEETDALLRIVAAGERYLVRLSDVLAVHVCRALVPVPATHPGLLGLSAARGQLLPVYALAVLLGRPVPQDPPRWLLVSAGAATAGLAFEGIEGIARLPAAAVREAAARERRQRHVAGTIADSSGPRALLDIRSVMDEVWKTVAHSER